MYAKHPPPKLGVSPTLRRFVAARSKSCESDDANTLDVLTKAKVAGRRPIEIIYLSKEGVLVFEEPSSNNETRIETVGAYSFR